MNRIILTTIFTILSFLYTQTPSESEISSYGLDDKLSVDEWKQAGCLERIAPVVVTKHINIVTDYGAISDGNFDNYSIIKDVLDNYLDTDGFTVIHFPEGRYKITNNLSLHSNMLIQGEGAKKTIFEFDFGSENKNYITMWNKHNVGIENIKMIRHNAPALSSVYAIGISGSYDCWVKGVHSYMATSKHIGIGNSPEYASHNIEIRGCYLHNTTNSGTGGNGYGIVIGGDTNRCLIEDNIFERLRHSMILVDNVSYNVLAYNASYDPWTSETYPDYFGREVHYWCGDIVFHGYHTESYNNGPFKNLIEGNRASTIHFDNSSLDGGILDDNYNGHWNVVFRNSATTTGFRIDNAVGSDTNGNERQVVINNYFALIDDAWIFDEWSVEDDCPYLYAKNNWTSDGIKKSEDVGFHSWVSLYRENRPKFLHPYYFMDDLTYFYYNQTRLPDDPNIAPNISWPVWSTHDSHKIRNAAHWRREEDYFNNDDLVSLTNSYTGIYPNDYLGYVNITKQPTTQYLLPGEDATFSVDVSGMEIENVEYQWYEMRINSYEWLEVNSYYGGSSSEITYPNFANAYFDVNPCEFRKFKCEIKSPSTKSFFTEEVSVIVFAKDAENYRTESIGNGDIKNWGSAETMTLDNVYVYAGGILNLSSGNSILLKPGFVIHEKGYLSAKLNFVMPNSSKYLHYTIIPIEQLKGIIDPITGAKL